MEDEESMMCCGIQGVYVENVGGNGVWNAISSSEIDLTHHNPIPYCLGCEPINPLLSAQFVIDGNDDD